MAQKVRLREMADSFIDTSTKHNLTRVDDMSLLTKLMLGTPCPPLFRRLKSAVLGIKSGQYPWSVKNIVPRPTTSMLNL